MKLGGGIRQMGFRVVSHVVEYESGSISAFAKSFAECIYQLEFHKNLYAYSDSGSINAEKR